MQFLGEKYKETYLELHLRLCRRFHDSEKWRGDVTEGVHKVYFT